MKYIVDGYNFLFHLYGGDNLQADREKMLSLLNSFAKKLSIEIVVVFDSHSFNAGYQRERCDAIEVQYTAFNETADQHILTLLQHGPKESTVVTSDKHVIHEAQTLGAKSIKVAPFYKWLLKKGQEKPKGEHSKPPVQDSEVSRYLKLFKKRTSPLDEVGGD